MKQFVTEFDVALTEWFVEKRKMYSESQTADPLFFELFDAVESIARAGGKRVRPYMAYLMYHAVKGKKMDDYRPLIALELFHVFCLIHDDIIDNGDSRRGVPTVHRTMIDKWYHGNIHIGESQAMLMGDMVLSWCHQLFDESDSSKEVKTLFTQMQEAVIIGQMIDVDITTQQRVTMQRIEQKMKLKTSSYTFVYPMQIGVALGGGSAELMNFCQEFGLALGLGFQIQDDILDIYADESISGKTPLRDIAEGQHTYITQYVFEHGNNDDITTLERLFHTDISAADVIVLRDMFERTGAMTFATQTAADHFATARTILAEQAIDEDIRHALRDGVAYIESRSA